MRSLRDGHASRDRQSEAGFTIMELLVVMGLAAFLMTLGATVFLGGGQGATFSQAVSDVAALVSTARDASSTVPAALVIDPEAGEIRGMTSRMLQELRFEVVPAEEGDDSDEIDVAQGIRGFAVENMEGEVLERGGHVGGGLKLAAGQTIDCGNYAPYDVTDGVHMGLFVKPERRASGTLIEKGQAFSVAFSGAGRLSVKIQVEGEGGEPEMVERTVKLPPVRAGEWIGVFVTYDRQFLTTETDHGYGPVERDRFAETRPLRLDPDASLVVGGGTLEGVIDDFVFAGVHSSEPIRMPRDVSLLGKSRIIRFSGGRLDAAAHQDNQFIGIRFKGKIRTLEIGKSGSVQSVTDTQVASQTSEEVDSSGTEFDKAE